jgi:hypothetical protein
MTDAPDSPQPPPRGLATSTYVIAGCGLVFLIGLPVVIIVALTLLGSSLDRKFDAIQAEICKSNPSDPSCR